MTSASNPYSHASEIAQRMLTYRNTATVLAYRGYPAHIVERYRSRAQQLAAALIGAGCRSLYATEGDPR